MKAKGLRLLAVILITFFIVSNSISVSAKYYSDIAISNPYRDNLNYVTDRGYIDPTSNTLFSPNTDMKRGDVVLMLYRYDGTNSSSTNHPFTDVPSKYAKAVTWAYNNNIINGVSATLFAPNNSITREDLCTVLYRYAMYRGSETLNTIDNNALIGYNDAYQIHSYARTPMKWAVTHGLITGTSPTTLSPQSYFIREHVAILMRRYHLRIDKFRWGKDNYSFINNPTYFTDGYHINAYHLGILNYYCSLYNNQSLYNTVLTKINKPWKGSCGGMALTSLLQLNGKINFPGNFGGNSVKNIYNLSSSSSLRSAINYYQLIQSVFFSGNSYSAITSGYINSIKNCIDTNGPTAIAFAWYDPVENETKAHAVLAYKYVLLSNGKTDFLIYDPNSTSSNIKLTFDPNNGTCKYGSINATSSLFYTLHNQYDLDFEYNDFGAGNSQNSTGNSNIANNNGATFTITMRGCYSIINEEKQTLTINGNSITGDMEVISKSFVANGPESPAEIVITVPESSSFKFESNDNVFQGEITFAANNRFSVIEGKEIHSVVFSESSIEVNSENESVIEIISATDSSLKKMIGIKGTTSGCALLQREKEKISISGVDQIQSVTIYNCDKTTSAEIFESVDVVVNNSRIEFEINENSVRLSKQYVPDND